MASGKACALAACALLAATMSSAGAEEAAIQGQRPFACTPGPNALGVARVVQIDTDAGPRFGFQYKEQDFLADGEVVLTFDDGPLRAYTRPVLDALAAHCTRATFFLVGRMAVADPDMVKEYARRGHTIGTHTWSHANLSALSPQRAQAELELGFSAVQEALGKPLAPFFRFPYLRDSKGMIAYAQERRIGVFSIDVDSKDFRTRDGGTVHRRVMEGLARTKKGIILFHDIQPSTAHALPGLLSELKARGYRVVHLVPKAPAVTVAEFDAQARQAMERRRATAAANPLARRAVTWPVTEGAGAELGAEAQPAADKAQADGAARKTRRPPRPLARVRAKGEDWGGSLWSW